MEVVVSSIPASLKDAFMGMWKALAFHIGTEGFFGFEAFLTRLLKNSRVTTVTVETILQDANKLSWTNGHDETNRRKWDEAWSAFNHELYATVYPWHPSAGYGRAGLFERACDYQHALVNAGFFNELDTRKPIDREFHALFAGGPTEDPWEFIAPISNQIRSDIKEMHHLLYRAKKDHKEEIASAMHSDRFRPASFFLHIVLSDWTDDMSIGVKGVVNALHLSEEEKATLTSLWGRLKERIADEFPICRPIANRTPYCEGITYNVLKTLQRECRK